MDWLADPVDWEEVVGRPQCIPNSEGDEGDEGDEFGGFGGSDDGDGDGDQAMADGSRSPCLRSTGGTSELALKSAIVGVLGNIAVEPALLLDSLSRFAAQLTSAIAGATAQLAADSEFLQQYPSVVDNDERWGDDATDALGLHALEAECLYWGTYHQLYPLVSLLGRVLQLQADTAHHAPSQLAAEQLLGAWCQVVDTILPAHAANPALIEGAYSVADALRFVAARDSATAASAVGQQAAAALSCEQLAQVMPLVERNFASTQHSLRLKTLQFLSAFEQPVLKQDASGSSSSGKADRSEKGAEPSQFIQMGIELESTAANLETYKDRIGHLRRMTAAALAGRAPRLYGSILPSLLAAQLSVNFSYLWPEATKQLGLLAGPHRERYWRVIWGLLRRFSDERRLIETGPTPKAKKWLKRCSEEWSAQAAYAAQPKLDGHAMECPNHARADRVYAAEAARFTGADGQRGAALHCLLAAASCHDVDHVDYANVRKLLLKVLLESGAAAAEAHSQAVVREFLAAARFEFGWTTAFHGWRAGSELGLDAGISSICAPEHRGLLVERKRRTADEPCLLWLSLLAKFRRPQEAHAAPMLHELYLYMLTRADSEVQRRALDCLLAWRQPEVLPYADNLRNLIDDKRFRDELKTFDLAVDEGSINVMHRDQLMPVVLRLLHGQMMSRSGKATRKDGAKHRRAAILSVMAGITQQELQAFVGIGLDTFRSAIARATPRELLVGDEAEVFSLTHGELPASADGASGAMDIDHAADGGSQSSVSAYVGPGAEMDEASPKALLSYFHFLLELLRHLGHRSTPVFHESLAVVLSAISWAQRQLDIANDQLEQLAANQGDSAGAAAGEDEDEDEDADADADADDAEDTDTEGDDEHDGSVLGDDGEDVADDGDSEAGSRGEGEITRGDAGRRKKTAREVRQVAMLCLIRMFTLMTPAFSFTPYMQCIYEVVVDPRIDSLAAENTQSSSALLRLLKSWTLSPRYLAYLVDYNPLTFPMLLDILVAPKVQPAVVGLVLDILQVFLDYSPETAVSKHALSAEDAEKCGALVHSTLQAHVSRILAHMRTCFADGAVAPGAAPVGQRGGSSLVSRQIHILSKVSEYATKETQDAKALLGLLLPMLQRPNAAVPERTKTEVLKSMHRFIPLVLDPSISTLSNDEQQQLLLLYLSAISRCFGRLRLDSARTTLTQILLQLAHADRALRAPAGGAVTPLGTAAAIVEEINAYSAVRLDEPDHDRRLAAFAHLNEELWCDPALLDANSWVPILHNLVYFAQDQEELSTRANAAFGLSRFVTRVAQAHSVDAVTSEIQGLDCSMVSIVLPAIKRALASRHEVIQVEFLGVLRRVVRECGQFFEQLRDLVVLDDAEEEANFFYNILHVQTHRRIRAMLRFRNLVARVVQTQADGMDVDSGEAGGAGGGSVKSRAKAPAVDRGALRPLNFSSGQASPISATNIRTLVFPLLEGWALAEGARLNNDLANEAIQTIGILGTVLPWSQFNAAIRKYLGMIKRTPKLEKRLMRLVMSLLDNFHFDLRNVKVDGAGQLVSGGASAAAAAGNLPTSVTDTATDRSADKHNEATDEGDREGEGAEEEEEDADDNGAPGRRSEDEAGEAANERIHSTVVSFLLPELKKRINNVDEDNMALRAPLAMSVIRILTALPEATRAAQLPGVLTSICNMLRARAQSARNTTRETLIRIIKFLGPTYFGFLVKELSASLSRGPQKHILSYTIYTMLKETVSTLSVGDLDYTLEPLVEILVQDVFGQVGEDKESEDWTSKIREAKVHHGPDCFEMLAAVTHFENMRVMLAPLRDILRETDTPKRTRLVDDVLRRITIGLNRNRSYSPKTVLVFCHGIIKQYLALSATSAKDAQQSKEDAEARGRQRFASGEDEVTVHVRRKDVLPKRDYLQANAHRFVQFGLGVVYFGLKRERFDTKDPEVLGMLDPFVDLTGDGLYSRYNSVIALCCKTWAIMVRMPLPSVPEGIPVVIRRLFAIFGQSSSTDSELIQNCFKLLASLLRSKHAEDLMADYAPEDLVMADDAPGNGAARDAASGAAKGKSGPGKKPASTPAAIECMKKSLLSEAQLRDLIDFIRPDIEEPERQATAFSLIRAVLTRRMIVDSLYKLLDTVRGLMVSAQDASARELCRLTWFQFLMDYPLGERRLANAMSFVVQNASGYVYESGRVSALEIMGVIINRFTDGILLPTAAEPFFLGLVLIVARDESSQCREMAARLLPELVARFDQPRLRRMWVLVDQWTDGISGSLQLAGTTGSKPDAATAAKLAKMRELGRTALQCYGFVIEPLGDRFLKQMPAFLSAVDTALSVSLRTWRIAEQRLNHIGGADSLEAIAANLQSGSDPHYDALAYWETAYTALGTFGRFVKAMPRRAVGDSGQSRIWQLVARHLTHPHAWVRLAAARAIGAYVGQADPSWMLEADAQTSAAPQQQQQQELAEWEVPEYRGAPKHVLMSTASLRQLTNGMLVQLGSRYATNELGDQVVKNLYFIAKCFLAAVPGDALVAGETGLEGQASSDDDSDNDSGDEDGEDEDEDGDADMAQGDALDEDAGVDAGGPGEPTREQSLLWLINKVGGLARTEIIRGRGTTEKRTYCFRWFAAVIALVPPALLTQPAYIEPMLSPLYRTTENVSRQADAAAQPGGAARAPTEQASELRTLANEVTRLLQSRIGVTAFSAILVRVQKHIGELRNQRRERRKQRAIADPVLHSQKKLRKHKSAMIRRRERDSEQARKRVRTVVRRARGAQ
ncbi:U3 snoRNP protein [Coemansia biformis]|uniref:U3 snoRNP protein n=1 Tax=Coemansia biformis TaxID=1286918 RepID=A0A9W7YFW4_9FUNG|nr:U3 snoRNP protein [Coemansia biformis]